MTYQSFDGHGVDVAVKRADDVDKKSLAYIADNPGCRALDLGSGAGGQSVRMALAGSLVTAVDQYDFASAFTDLRTEHSLENKQLEFIKGDLVRLDAVLPDDVFDVVVLQRTLHYLSHKQAVELLKYLRIITKDKLYVSVTGTKSLVGDTYQCTEEPIVDRFCELSDLGKEMFSIVEPVCLYDQTEFVNILESAGFVVDECWESAFGNIKAVCSVPLDR